VTFLDALRRDAQGLADAAELAGLDTVVGACPGWDIADLVWHTGEVHWFWRIVVQRNVADPKEIAEDELARPPADDLLAWYRDNAERLHATLTATDPSTPVWTWAPQKDVAFVRRRMAQETAVHRWDAEMAAGHAHAIEPELALDGIDEFLRFMTAWVRSDAAPLGGSVHLDCTDSDRGWVVSDPDPTGPVAFTPEHAAADVTVRGTASDLLLLLWRRVSLDRVEVLGDQPVLDRLLARTDNE
jgi:uncharacterized protein (TIGR03083 family)